MRQTIFVFAVVASLLMLACAATSKETQKASGDDLFGGLKETMKELISPLLKDKTISSFKLSSIFGLFDNTLEEVKSYGKDIELLHEQSLKEYKDIESIFTSAKAAAEKASKSGALTQKINFIASRAETGKAQKEEIEKDRKLVQTKQKEAETAKKEFEDKEVQLASKLLNIVTYLTTASTPATAPAAISGHSFLSSTSTQINAITASTSSTGGLMALVKEGAPIAAEMYSAFKKFSKASTESREAFQEAKIASKTIKQYLTESQEIQTCLNPQS